MLILSQIEFCNFGRKLAYHTAPTLLGIKCASLISLRSSEFDLDYHTRYFNSRAAVKGLKSRLLCRCGSRTLMLVYREEMLQKRLSEASARKILAKFGYCDDFTLEECLERLSERVKESRVFPHEIGIFLGYPIEDVMGFIANNGDNFKLCGAWKVYENVEGAKRTFDNYNKCRRFLCNKLDEGFDLYQALKITK